MTAKRTTDQPGKRMRPTILRLIKGPKRKPRAATTPEYFQVDGVECELFLVSTKEWIRLPEDEQRDYVQHRRGWLYRVSVAGC